MRIPSIVAALVLLVSMVAYSDDDQKIYSLGEFSLESGQILSDAKLSYTTHGQLNEDGTNVILLPSFYLGDHHGYDFLIGTDKALKPSEYFIVAVDITVFVIVDQVFAFAKIVAFNLATAGA